MILGVARTPIAATAGLVGGGWRIRLPKATGASTSIAAGTKVYWDAADKQAKADDESGANKFWADSRAAADDDATVVCG